MLNNRIYVLSQPIQTGKTSLLMQWVKTTPNVSGILTPDVDGLRMLYDISSQTYTPLQLAQEDAGIKIGRFTFSEKGFAHAQHLLTEATKQQYDWLVIDEIGRLEMDQSTGLEPAVSSIINDFQSQNGHAKLLLVIRDYLLNQAVTHYNLQNAVILDRTFFDAEKSRLKPLFGLVLCGGQSVRMGTDKAFVNYHGKPQYEHTAALLAPFCKAVFISCNEQQKPKLSPNYKSFVDSATFQGNGPMSGLLTAFEHHPDAAFLLVGCDYPNLEQADIAALVNARSNDVVVTCYQNSVSGINEPLLAIYENSAAPLLKQFIAKNQFSLRHFLTENRIHNISHPQPDRIQSVDFPIGNKPNHP